MCQLLQQRQCCHDSRCQLGTAAIAIGGCVTDAIGFGAAWALGAAAAVCRLCWNKQGCVDSACLGCRSTLNDELPDCT